MSAVEETRKAIQDFIAPEIRTLSARLDAVEYLIKSSDARAEKRHEEAMTAIRAIADYTSLSVRVARVEAKQESHS